MKARASHRRYSGQQVRGRGKNIAPSGATTLLNFSRISENWRCAACGAGLSAHGETAMSPRQIACQPPPAALFLSPARAAAWRSGGSFSMLSPLFILSHILGCTCLWAASNRTWLRGVDIVSAWHRYIFRWLCSASASSSCVAVTWTRTPPTCTLPFAADCSLSLLPAVISLLASSLPSCLTFHLLYLYRDSSLGGDGGWPSCASCHLQTLCCFCCSF